MNKQRETIYGLCRKLMEEPDQREYLLGDLRSRVRHDLLSNLTRQYLIRGVSQTTGTSRITRSRLRRFMSLIRC